MTDKEFRERFFEIWKNSVKIEDKEATSGELSREASYKIYEFLIAIERMVIEFEEDKEEEADLIGQIDLNKYKSLAITSNDIVYWLEPYAKAMSSTENHNHILEFMLRHIQKGENVSLEVVKEDKDVDKYLAKLHPKSCIDGGRNL